MEWKRNRKGLENYNDNYVELKLNGMEWNQNGNGMENLRQKKLTRNRIEMEWKQNEDRTKIKKTHQVEVKIDGR